MSLNRTRFWYNGADDVSFNYSDGYIIDFPTGVCTLDAVVDTVRNADGVGVATQQKSVPERNISINGYVIALPSEEYRRKLERCFAPLSSGRLWAETESGELFFLDCVSAAAPVIQGAKRMPRFQVALMAEYPYWQRDTYQELTLFKFGASGNAISAEIVSDVPVPFQVVFSASDGCQGVAIGVGNDELRYTGSISSGQALSIQVDEKGRVTALLDGESVIGNVTGGLKKLPAGKQNIRLEGVGDGVSITAKIKYREARAGV